MTKFVHIVQVHPVYNGALQTHKVKLEKEFETKEEADTFITMFNIASDINDSRHQAVYYGCVNDLTGELV